MAKKFTEHLQESVQKDIDRAKDYGNKGANFIEKSLEGTTLGYYLSWAIIFFFFLPLVLWGAAGFSAGAITAVQFFIAVGLGCYWLYKREKANELATELAKPIEGEVKMSVAMNIETGVSVNYAVFKKRTATKLAATFEFSEKAKHEARRKNITSRVFITTPHRDPSFGTWDTTVADLFENPAQEFYFDNYNEAVEAIETVKKNLSILKSVLEHGTDAPIQTTFEA